MNPGRLLGCSLLLALAACTAPLHPLSTEARLRSLPQADALLLGEQHDAPEHQRIHEHVVQALARQGRLAALALEMAEQGVSTVGLAANATEAQVQEALKWDGKAWPWAAYGPAVMAAVSARVTVLGANLPRRDLRGSMGNAALDALLPAAALQTQRERIRSGHCNMLPDSQIAPMTRMQIARDQAMAQTMTRAAQPGKTVVLLSGAGHADRLLGVPQHLPKSIKANSVLLLAGAGVSATDFAANFDQTWPTAAVPERDYCAEFKATRAP